MYNLVPSATTRMRHTYKNCIEIRVELKKKVPTEGAAPKGAGKINPQESR